MQIPRFLSALLLLLQFLAVEASLSYRSSYPPDRVDKLAAEGLLKLAKYEARHNPRNECTIKNAVKRKEWSDLSPKERIAYTKAVLCFQSKPPITPSSFAPGARSRYDDFIVTHINQTFSIHGTGNFLSWHRYFIHEYDKALRKECGYKGYQPYWNWGRYAADPIHSPLFDGSATSLGGNGASYKYSGTSIPGALPGLNDIIPSGEGGGCVTTGPFKDMSVNLGPLAASVPGVPPNPDPSGMGYNPRCLRRDINPYASAFTADNYTTTLITKKQNKDIYWFQTDMQGKSDPRDWGVHSGGHFTIGGDPGGDFFTSPGDPAFYLHHGQIDRVWWIWQLHNLPYSLTAVSGTLTVFNQPPSANATIDDPVDLGLNGKEVKLGSLLNTLGGLGGEFCYIYV